MTYLVCAVFVVGFFLLVAGRHVLGAVIGAVVGSYFGASGFGTAVFRAKPSAVLGLILSKAVW